MLVLGVKSVFSSSTDTILYRNQNLCLDHTGLSVKKLDNGFTLIEMLIVIAIVGILAAVALPVFQMYAIQARLTEVTNGMSNVASAVAAYYEDAASNGVGSWPNCGSVAAIQTTLGLSIGSLGRIQAMSIDGNGVITATVHNINPTVDGKSLTLTPSLAIDSSISWAWGASSDFPENLRPRK